MAVKTTATQATKKDTKAPAKKAPAAKTSKTPAKPVVKAQEKAPSKPQAKVITKEPEKAGSGKTIYHVSKRDNDGREWKVFIQGSNKVIKLFGTQKEALDYAKSLCNNKDDGSYVLLHGLDGKMRKF